MFKNRNTNKLFFFFFSKHKNPDIYFQSALAHVADGKASKAKIKALSHPRNGDSPFLGLALVVLAFCSTTQVLGKNVSVLPSYCLNTCKQGIQAEQMLNQMTPFGDNSETLGGVPPRTTLKQIQKLFPARCGC